MPIVPKPSNFSVFAAGLPSITYHEYSVGEADEITRSLVRRLADGDLTTRNYKKLIRKYFLNPAAKFNAAMRSLQRSKPKRVEGETDAEFDRRRIEFEQTFDTRARGLARVMNLFVRCTEPVSVWREPKNSMIDPVTRQIGLRPLCNLGDRMYAQHLMINDVIAARYKPSDYVHDFSGRGRDHEARKISVELERNPAVVVGDVKSSFGCFNPQLTGSFLGLPAEVVRWNLNPSNLNFRHSVERERTQALARGVLYSTYDAFGRHSFPNGLLQGSPCSNLIQAMVYDPLVRPGLPGCSAFINSDNVVVFGASEVDAGLAFSNLQRRFAESPLGTFVIVEKDRSPPSSEHHAMSFAHNGYEYFKRSVDEAPTKTVPLEKRGKFAKRFVTSVQNSIAKGIDEEDAIAKQISIFLGGYNEVDDKEEVSWDLFEEMQEELWQVRNHAGLVSNHQFMQSVP